MRDGSGRRCHVLRQRQATKIYEFQEISISSHFPFMPVGPVVMPAAADAFPVRSATHSEVVDVLSTVRTKG